MNDLEVRYGYKNESGRLRALHELEILDTPPDRELDDLVHLAAEICGTPISLISLVDARRQWFKAAVGLTMQHTHRDLSFCSHAILQRELFIVEDAKRDRRFAENPLVTGDPNIRFYAGMPFESTSGHAIGTLCVIDTVPRRLKESQQGALKALAGQVKSRMESRLQRRELEAALQQKDELAQGLQESEALFRLFMNNSPFASYIKDSEGRMIYYNSWLAERFGVSQEDWLGLTDMEIWPADHARVFRADDLKVLTAGKPLEVIDHTVDTDGKTTSWKSFKFPYRDGRGNMMLAGISVDITEELVRKSTLEKSNEELHQMAMIDVLTGLKNRRAFDERLSLEFAVTRQTGNKISVMMIDVDNFKNWNDTWGHAAGDEVLRRLGAILSATVSHPNTVARYGGEEFIVLMPETDAEPMQLARRLQKNVSTEQWEHGSVTLSFGVATSNSYTMDASELVRIADRGLYRAKRAGKDRVKVSHTVNDDSCIMPIAPRG